MKLLDQQACRARQRRLWQLVDAADAGPNRTGATVLLLVTHPKHVMYLANVHLWPFVFRSCDAPVALALTRDKTTLFLDHNARMFAEGAAVDQTISPTWYDGKHSAPARTTPLQTALTTWLRDFCASQSAQSSLGIRFDQADCSHVVGSTIEQLFPNHAVALTDKLPTMRRQKDPDEIALLKRCCAAGDAGHRAAREQFRAGMSELDLYVIVQNAAIKSAGHPVIVYGDFAVGARTEQGGGPPTDRVAAPGDLVLLDYSVVIGDYRCDFTNTFVVDGNPTREQQQVYETCLAAMRAGEQMLVAGTPAKEVDHAVRQVMTSAGYGQAFRHHTGHGIGLSHPEAPFIVPESSDTLLAGDVVTLEPGAYLPGVGGIRIEHNYLITPTGFERLSNHELTLT